MNKRFKIITILSVIIVAVFSAVILTFGVSAKSESELSASITKKVKYANLFNCYNNSIHQNAETLNFSSAVDLFLGSDGTLVGPEGWSGIPGKCSDLVSEMIGVVPSDQPARGQILQKLGYSGGGASSRCVWFEYTRNSSDGVGGLSTETIRTDRACASVAADGTMSNYEVENTVGEPYDVIEFDGKQLRASYDDKVNGGVFDMYVNGYNNNWNSFVNKYTETLNKMNGRSSFLGANGVTGAYYTPSSCPNSSGAACTEDVSAGSGSYSIVNRNTAASIAASNYLGLSNGNFTTAEKVSLYQFYLKNHSSSIVCNPTNTPDPSMTYKVKLVINSRYYENCYAVERETAGTLVHAVDGSFSLNDTIGYQGIIDALNSMTAITDREGIIDPGASIGAEMGTPITDNPGDNPGDNSGGENGGGSADPNDVCYGAEGTLGLSWILCPITQMLYDALNSTYDVVENNFLKLEGSELLTNETRDKWSIFQNIANIIFVILLLIVIFSQLTGIGIDNYGIKKILPRLIICAILVNLSFFITQLLVDASDIIGVSARNIFENISAAGGDQATGGAVAGEAAGVGLIAVTAGVTIGAFVLNPALLLSLLLALLTGVISVLMLLVILIARKVGVVVAVIIAPLAFVSYLLPNTSKWLKSWGNLMKGLLILYPLAAGLVGASAFVGDLIGNMAGDGDSGKWMYLAAMLVRVVPFFFLPTLFRRSLNAIGNLGTTIQGFGRNLSGGLNRTTRNAEWFRNAQDRGTERRTRLRAGLDREGNEATGIGRLFRSHNRRARARYRAQYLKDRAARDDAEMMHDPQYFDVLKAKQESELEKKQSEAQASALKSGRFTYTDHAGVSHTITDPNSGSALRDAYIAEASKAADQQDVGKLRALYDAIRAKGDAGIDILGEIWDNGRLNTSGRGFMDLRDNIVADSEIKSKARTLHTVAKNVQGGVAYSGNQVSNARAAGAYIADIAPEKIPDLTSAEMNALNDRAQSGDATAQNVLQNAWSDERIRNRLKGEDKGRIEYSLSHRIADNFNSHDSTNDEAEIWAHADGRIQEVYKTPDGIYYNADNARLGQAINMSELRNQGFTRQQ